MFDKPPFLDWTLDRWKIVVIFLLFMALLFMSMFRVPTTESVTLPGGPSRAASAEALAAAETQPTPGAASMSEGALAAPASDEPSDSATDSNETGSNETNSEMSGRRSGVATTDPVFPLTLAGLAANAIVPQAMVTTLEGTAGPGNRVEVHSRLVARPGSAGAANTTEEARFVGTAEVAADGRWRLPVDESFEAGQHEITLIELNREGVVLTTGKPTLITVLTAGEKGPLSLATPTIRFPSVGARLRSGRITFVGTGLPGMRVQLYLDSRPFGETSVNSREEWRLTPDSDIQPGVYVARVVALSPEGTSVAESSPVAFAVYDSPLGLIPPYMKSEELLPLEVTDVQVGPGTPFPLLVSGTADPNSEVTLWLRGDALLHVNAGIDGGWRMWVSESVVGAPIAELGGLTFRSDLGEITTVMMPEAEVQTTATEMPVLLAPTSGEVLTTRRPVMAGTAQPSSKVSVAINGTIVAVVQADSQGHWAYQVQEPLLPGEVEFAALPSASMDPDDRAVKSVLATVSPQL